jgi:di-N-acetylchitobiase
VPFRGCPCSDAAGKQYCYSDIYKQLVVDRNTTTGRQWDDLLDSPWFNYLGADGT